MYSNHVPRLLARSLYNEYLDNIHDETGKKHHFDMKDVNAIRQTMGLTAHRKREGFESFVFSPQKNDQQWDFFMIATPVVREMLLRCYNSEAHERFARGHHGMTTLWQYEYSREEDSRGRRSCTNIPSANTMNIFSRNMFRTGCVRLMADYPIPPSFVALWQREIIKTVKSVKKWYEDLKADEDGTNLSKLFETEKEEVILEGSVIDRIISTVEDDNDYDTFMREASE